MLGSHVNLIKSELLVECHDNVSTGKYTIGLGQERMAVCNSSEDAISISLNAFSRLLTRFKVDVTQIGRIEVGSESNPDRAKAIKSHLIGLLGKLPISGSDNVQACYGGTAALLNAAAWLESSQWENGKVAIVVAGDVAVYDSGAARATGGAGSVAILLARGQNAPIKLEPRFGHFASHIYDFYKPDPLTEYPKVDGPLSVTAYLQSALNAYSDWQRKDPDLHVTNQTISDQFDQLIFHSPYSKIVYKAFCQLQLFERGRLKIQNVNALSADKTREIDELFRMKVEKNLEFSKNLGNSYCASVFFNLLCALIKSSSCPSRIGVFSYGSGSMATFFSFNYSGDQIDWLNDLSIEIESKFQNRIKISPENYEILMKRRKEMYGITNWTVSEIEIKDTPMGTFYLSQIDSEHRRFYKQK